MVLGSVTLGIIAVFLPPLPVLWRAGCGAFFLISIGLMFLGWLPAVVFAWFVILDKPSIRQRAKRNRRRRSESSISTYEERPSPRNGHFHERPFSQPKESYYSRQETGYVPSRR
ncbi:Hypothetical protein R9X50_00251500 [Acrodontium crateriforme]|uniref:Uncharacterized protein n=1 Tax=Acrodontium crateriforme TaxID=150365 RepID=A0AAQ3M121_9PEZI|nr:Hypothetical protein R9X50_00251500 [Acrodontium crateriforme]